MAGSVHPLDARHELGRRVRARRLKLGLSQERLSERSGHHPTYVASIERGERNITVETLLRLAVALEVDPARLVRGLTPERPQSASRDR